MTGAAARLALLALLHGCGGDHARDFGRADTAAAISDAADRSVAGDVADTVGPETDAAPIAADELITAADSAAGDILFHRRGQCFTCHGASGAGLARLGRTLQDDAWLHSDGSVSGIRRTISEGVAVPRQAQIAMPGFGRQLSERELDQLAAYVYAISRPGSVIEFEPRSETGAPLELPVP